MKKTLCIWALLIMSIMISAQNLSVDSCKMLALRNNASVKNAAIDVSAAREMKAQTFTKYFPQINALAGGYHALYPFIEYGINDINNTSIRVILNNLYYQYGAAIGLPNSISLCEKGIAVSTTAMQPLFMGGQIINGNKLAKVGVQVAELQQQLTEEQITLQVEETYWLVISLQEKKKTLQQAITFLDTLHRDVTVAKENGLVTTNDQLRIRLKLNETRSYMLQVDNNVTLATMMLCQLTGIPYSDNIILTDTIPTETTSEKIEADLDAAVFYRKETQLLTLSLEVEKLRKKMAIGESLPHLMIGASASYGNLIFKNYKNNAFAFASLQVPLTGWWETAHKIKQNNLLIQKALNQQIDLTQKMRLETEQAYNNMREAIAQVTLMEENLQLAHINLKSIKVNYEAGIVSISDLLEAQTLYRQAQDQLIDARIQQHIKHIRAQTLQIIH